MPTDDELWGLVPTVFKKHRRRLVDINAHAAFERVAQKCLGLAERRRFSAEDSDIRLESLSRADLDDIIVYHDRSKPKGIPEFHHGPLVMIEIDEKRYVIDGNNRVNLWRNTDADGLHEAIIVTPRNQ